MANNVNSNFSRKLLEQFLVDFESKRVLSKAVNTQLFEGKFDPSSGESFSLNPIAVEILEMVKKNLAKDEIKTEIINKYDVDSQTFEHNYFDFIGLFCHNPFILFSIDPSIAI